MVDLPYNPEDFLDPDVPVEDQVFAPPTRPVQSKPPLSTTGVDSMMAGNPARAVAAQQPDRYDTLSKTQKRMLAFAAMRDAGMALQGKSSSAVADMMSAFTDRADMQRKADAAKARREYLAQLTLGGMDEQSIINAMMMGAIDGTVGNAMLAQIRAKKAGEKAQEAVVSGSAGALDDLNRLDDILSEAGMVTGFTGWLFSKLPWSQAKYARDIADTLRSGMALGALKELKAGGATLGSVSEKELDLLESAIAKLNLDAPEEDVREQMRTIERHYKNSVRLAYEAASEEERAGFDRHFGGATPDWVFQSTETAPDSSNVTVDDLSDEEKEELGLI